MFGRSVNSFLLLLLFLASTPALARTSSFYTDSIFGFGVFGGAEKRPRSGFVAGTQRPAAEYEKHGGLMPFLDFGNVSFGAYGAWHQYPVVTGSGTDAHGTYTESCDANSFDYGLRVLLAPFVSEKARERLYFAAAFGDSVVRIANQRKYSTGAMANTTNDEKARGSGLTLSGGLGYETFLVQSWSIAIEAGYIDRSIESFHYASTIDAAGTSRTESDVPKDAAGNNQGFHSWSPYAQIFLNLNL